MKKIWIVDPAEAGIIMENISDEIASLVPEEKKMTAALIFEEVFTNVANYAYKENERLNQSKPLKIVFEIFDGKYFFTFTDCGSAFDPTIYQPKEPDEIQIGGHGIRIVKQLSKKIVYKRIQNKKNELVIEF